MLAVTLGDAGDPEFNLFVFFSTMAWIPDVSGFSNLTSVPTGIPANDVDEQDNTTKR
jgi:hypothetical protein